MNYIKTYEKHEPITCTPIVVFDVSLITRANVMCGKNEQNKQNKLKKQTVFDKLIDLCNDVAKSDGFQKAHIILASSQSYYIGEKNIKDLNSSYLDNPLILFDALNISKIRQSIEDNEPKWSNSTTWFLNQKVPVYLFLGANEIVDMCFPIMIEELINIITQINSASDNGNLYSCGMATSYNKTPQSKIKYDMRVLIFSNDNIQLDESAEFMDTFMDIFSLGIGEATNKSMYFRTIDVKPNRTKSYFSDENNKVTLKYINLFNNQHFRLKDKFTAMSCVTIPKGMIRYGDKCFDYNNYGYHLGEITSTIIKLKQKINKSMLDSTLDLIESNKQSNKQSIEKQLHKIWKQINEMLVEVSEYTLQNTKKNDDFFAVVEKENELTDSISIVREFFRQLIDPKDGDKTEKKEEFDNDSFCMNKPMYGAMRHMDRSLSKLNRHGVNRLEAAKDIREFIGSISDSYMSPIIQGYVYEIKNEMINESIFNGIIEYKHALAHDTEEDIFVPILPRYSYNGPAYHKTAAQEENIREWILFLYSKKFGTNSNVYHILYTFLIENLYVQSSNVPDDIKKDYRILVNLMLGMGRPGSSVTELSYLAMGNKPSPVFEHKFEQDSFESFFKKCPNYPNDFKECPIELLNPYTVWYATMYCLGNFWGGAVGDLYKQQMPREDDFLKYWKDAEVLFDAMVSYPIIPKFKKLSNEKEIILNYYCPVSMTDTSDVGGYMIPSHASNINNISDYPKKKSTTCQPQYVISEEVIDASNQKFDDILLKLVTDLNELRNKRIKRSDNKEVRGNPNMNKYDYLRTLAIDTDVSGEPTVKCPICSVPIVTSKLIKVNPKDTNELKLKQTVKKKIRKNKSRLLLRKVLVDHSNKLIKLKNCDFDLDHYEMKTFFPEYALFVGHNGMKLVFDFYDKSKSKQEIFNTFSPKFMHGLDMSSIVVAGDTCRDILLKQKIKTIDFYLIGIKSIEDRFERIVNLINDIRTNQEKENKEYQFILIHNKKDNLVEFLIVEPINENKKNDMIKDLRCEKDKIMGELNLEEMMLKEKEECYQKQLFIEPKCAMTDMVSMKTDSNKFYNENVSDGYDSDSDSYCGGDQTNKINQINQIKPINEIGFYREKLTDSFNKFNKVNKINKIIDINDITNPEDITMIDEKYLFGKNKVIYRIRIDLRSHKNLLDLFSKFDMDPYRIAFDGTTTYLTPAAEVSYKYKVNLINTKKFIRKNFDIRIKENFDMGFAIGINTSCFNCELKELLLNSESKGKTQAKIKISGCEFLLKDFPIDNTSFIKTTSLTIDVNKPDGTEFLDLSHNKNIIDNVNLNMIHLYSYMSQHRIRFCYIFGNITQDDLLDIVKRKYVKKVDEFEFFLIDNNINQLLDKLNTDEKLLTTWHNWNSTENIKIISTDHKTHNNEKFNADIDTEYMIGQLASPVKQRNIKEINKYNEQRINNVDRECIKFYLERY